MFILVQVYLVVFFNTNSTEFTSIFYSKGEKIGGPFSDCLLTQSNTISLSIHRMPGMERKMHYSALVMV